MAVTRVPNVEREAAQVVLAVADPLERQPQAHVLAIRVQRQSGCAPERSAEMKRRAADGARNAGERQMAGHAWRDPLLRAFRKICESWPIAVAPSPPALAVCERQHLIEQHDNALLDGKRLDIPGSGHVGEQLPLFYVHRGIGWRVHESHRPLVVCRGRIAIGERAAQEIVRHGKPVAAVAVGTQGTTFVTLVAVVERYDSRVGDERTGVAVMNHDRRSGEDEAILLNRTGIAERRMIDRAAKRADGDALGREDDAIGRRVHGCRVIVAAALVALHLVSAGAAGPQRVLFIGNSLTTANNLPLMLEAVARQRGETIACEMVAYPDFSLEDHWQRGDAVRAIARGGWTTVVLQQGPSALPESRVLLRAYVKKFDAEAKRAGARTALYMVWPSAARRGDFEGVHQSYARAAEDVGGLLLPVGDAWRAAWRRESGLPLYGSDGFHPTPLATYLAALVMLRQLTGASPVGLPPALTSASGAFPAIALTPKQADVVQHAAADASASDVSRRGAR